MRSVVHAELLTAFVIRPVHQGIRNLLSSSKKRSPSNNNWLGKACWRFMKLLTRIKNMMKMSRCKGDVRKKW